MATIQVKIAEGPTAMCDVGDAVLAAAKTCDTRAIKEKLAIFAKQHTVFVTAVKKVQQAEAALRAQQAKVGEADAEQDACVEALARARIADGAPRTQPFKPLGFSSPSTIAALGYEKEAGVVRKLAKKSAGQKEASKATLAAAKAADKAAARVLAALAPIKRLEKTYADALSARLALAQPWATSLAMLKRAARVAEDDGARGLFVALFTTTARPRASKAPKAAPNGAGTAPVLQGTSGIGGGANGT